MMTVVETKTCTHCQSSFDITQEDVDFYAKISPTFGDYVAEVPTPTLCSECRQRRRLAFRNERNLYKRTCDSSGKDIISIYSPDKPYTVYDQHIRRGDSRDPMDYGRYFDFSRTFTEQFGQLIQVVPRLNLGNYSSVNSEYNNYIMNSKDCYMAFSCLDGEGCLYSRNIRRSKNAVDCLVVHNSEVVYSSVDVYDSYNIVSSFHIHGSNDLSFCINCFGCSFCFLCSDLVNKKYYIKNKKYTKDSYFDAIRKSGGFYDLLSVYQDDLQEHPVIYHVVGNEGNCDIRNITDSKNVHYSFDIAGGESLSYCREIEKSHNCYDCTYGSIGSYLLEGFAVGLNSSRCAFFATITNGDNLFYCDNCVSGCSHLFGCVGLRNAQYCIFNRQYTKEEYNELVPKIIEHMKETGEWGEFFHPSLSPFGYNETAANDYYPLQGVQEYENMGLQDLGYKWSAYESPAPQVEKIIPGEKLPSQGCETISDQKPSFLQDIVRYAIRCQESGKLFRLIPQEIAFYTKHNLPLPRKHPDVRHAERMALRK